MLQKELRRFQFDTICYPQISLYSKFSLPVEDLEVTKVWGSDIF